MCKYVHFIGHSAGSNLIHHAIKTIKANSKFGLNNPTIHATFLDAFTPFLIEKFFYGEDLEDNDYAEHYVDLGLPTTSTSLLNAYNFEVAGLHHPPDDSGFFGHEWPIHWYQQSIANPSQNSFGFQQSFEYGGNGQDPSTFYVSLKQRLQSLRNISAGDVCVLTSNTECIKTIGLLRPTIVRQLLLGSSVTGGAPAVKTSPAGTVDLSLDEVAGVSATLKTDSPVWFEAPITTTQTFHFIKFNYEFLSAAGSEGILTVFVDDQLVYKIDERITDAGVNTTTPDIPVGELAPGNHTIGFRLDPFTAVQSAARISNIELGEVVTMPIPGTPNLQPIGITFDASTAVVGGTVFFDSGISNTGDIDTGVFNIKWFVNGQEVGAYGSHAGVPAGQTVLDGNSQFSWPFDSLGIHSVTFAVDVDNHIAESDEGDNLTTIHVIIQ